MSKHTPRTDAQRSAWADSTNGQDYEGWLEDFARTLELENADLLEALRLLLEWSSQQTDDAAPTLSLQQVEESARAAIARATGAA